MLVQIFFANPEINLILHFLMKMFLALLFECIYFVKHFLNSSEESQSLYS